MAEAEGESPLVSVIIPTYNRKDLLGRAVESCFRDTYRPIEVVVVDDGSKDGTEQVIPALEAAAKRDSQMCLRYIQQENRGAAAARNRGFGEIRGDYVRFLDSDDYMCPEATAAQVRALESSGAAVCYGEWRDLVMGESGQRRELVPELKEIRDPVATVLGDEWRPPFCYLMRRQTVVRSGGWDESYRVVDDVKFLLRVAFLGEAFVGVDVVAGCYLRHDGPRISTASRLAWVKEMGRILVDGMEFLDARNAWTEVRQVAVGRGLFDQARRCHAFDREQYRWCIRKMLELDPGFRLKGCFYPLAVRVFGYETAESLRQWTKKTLRRKL